MPRKNIPSPKDMQTWLDWLEEGMGETAIAHKAGRQPRTIKKYLLIAEKERRTNQAQLDLVKDALKTHQGQLTGMIDTLVQNVCAQPATPEIPWPFNGEPMIDITGGMLSFRYGENRIEVDIALSVDKSIELELVKEHLPGDPIWAQYKAWSLALWFYFQALATFKEKAASILLERTGGIFADENLNAIDIPGSGSQHVAKSSNIILMVNLLELVCKWSLKAILGHEGDGQIGTSPQDQVRLKEQGNRIKADLERGEIKYTPTTTLAFCRGDETKCRQAILDAYRSLLASSEARHLKAMHQKLTEQGSALLKTLQIIKLGILILGECQVCKRFRR
jgi:hypothetical protein